ncbi:MAG TPA: DUF3006 domain-containing protein [Blastocatellia bacterium]|nr:DUF3006 domain-containing protein [Blastocatellia bacterium]
MKLVVDRIEEGIAVCFLYEDDRVSFAIPLGYLPAGTRAGDHLRVTFELDPESRRQEQQKAESLLDELRKTSPPGRTFKL